MSIEWIDHKGKKILYINYMGLSSAERLAQIEKAAQTLVDTGKKDNLTLSDLRDTLVDQEFVDLSKAKGKISGQYTKKAAVLGIEGMKKILLKAVNAFSGNPREPFSTIEEAKEWLTKD
jgi:hypothetical protein